MLPLVASCLGPSSARSSARSAVSIAFVVSFVAVFLLCTSQSRASATSPPPADTAVRTLIRNGRYAAAESLARILELRTRARTRADSIARGTALDLLVESLWRGGKASRAETESLATEALTLRERLGGPTLEAEATSVNNAGAVHYLRAELGEARRAFEHLVTLREKSDGPENISVARALNNLANVLRGLGDFRGARSVYARSLAIKLKVLGPDDPDVAMTRTNLARAIGAMGDMESARREAEQALDSRQRTLPADHPNIGESLSLLAEIERSLGNYAEARDLNMRALEIQEHALGRDHPLVAQTMMQVASCLDLLGEVDESEQTLRHALALVEGSQGPDVLDAGRISNNLGLVRSEQGEENEAKRLFQRALAIEARLYGPDHYEVAQVHENLAKSCAALGEPDSAATHIAEAMRILIASVGPDHSEMSYALMVQARLMLQTGQPVAAESILAQSIRVGEMAGGRSHPDLSAPLQVLAETKARLGDAPGALEAALRAAAVDRELVLATTRSVPEREALRLAATRGGGLDWALALGSRTTDPAQAHAVLDAVVRGRALVLDEMASRHRAYAGADSTLARQIARLTEAQADLGRLLVQGPRDDSTRAYLARLSDVRARREDAELALVRSSAAFREDLRRRTVGVDDVARALPRGTHLVSFARYECRPVGTLEGPASANGAPARPTGQDRDLGVPGYVAFLLDREGRIRTVPLGRATVIDSLVAVWRSAVTAGPALPDWPGDSGLCREIGAHLRERVWDPIEPLLQGSRVVFVVPDGALHLVNLAALPDGSGRFLVEHGPVLHLISSERDLVAPSVAPPEGSGFLVMGGPDFEDTTEARAPESIRPGSASDATRGATAVMLRGAHLSCAVFRSVVFGPLPGASREVETVRAICSSALGHVRQANTAGDLDVLLGAHATEDAFKHQAPGRRTVHIATHGFVMNAECDATPGTDDPGRGPVARPRVSRENPLWLSGLAMAGANRRNSATAGRDDGILTAEEIASVDLSGVDWAVLSACETGVGAVQVGEGVLGLRRAFQVAGARTLILSLWSVQDEATREWMAALYRARFQEHRSAANAVREASLRTLRARRARKESTHPLYWAAFVATGDWR
jgi:CHAT domain-containing protein/tetratricopeptide (TPR) repeat protein